MILKFRVANYRSFRDEASISFVSTRLDTGYGLPTPVAADGSTVDVLPVVAVLGANASGKSNLLRAMKFMRTMVLTSASRPRYADSELEADPFRLDPACRSLPTVMELDFVLDGARYVYGFELRGGRFTDEWLHTFPHKRSQTLFDREDVDEFQFGKNLTGHNRVITDITRPQVLFLSAAAQAGHPILSKIYDFFVDNLILLDVPERGRTSPRMISRLTERRGRAVQLLALADLGIHDARVDSSISDEQREQVRKRIESSIGDTVPEDEREQRVEQILNSWLDQQEPTVELLHRAGKASTPLPFEEESLGTKSWLSFVSFALDALDHGGVLLVDELDASLHPLLIAEALQLFQSRRTNRHGAQLIFTTHDVTLLSNSLERFKLSRGQVWLVEKTEYGGSTLTALSDYRPRKGEDLARGYLQGRYGGTPRILPATAGDVLVSDAEARHG